ncbi:MAG: DUF2235 domain-containing protein [Comamonadaceae bacterium]|nr:DUF2235 domain-containing protein [Comamonadaceae bacterium]
MQIFECVLSSGSAWCMGHGRRTGFSGIFGNGDQAKYQFHNVKLNPEVKAAYHALALDEERAVYANPLGRRREKATGQIVEQVWFAGVHCDIGGGYPEAYHSDIAFRWMLEKAVAHGLKIRANHGYIFHSDLEDTLKKTFTILIKKSSGRESIGKCRQ